VRDVVHVESFNGSRYETETYAQIDEAQLNEESHAA
jgi:type IV secretion system protein VirB11